MAVFNPHTSRWDTREDIALVLQALAVTGSRFRLACAGRAVAIQMEQVVFTNDAIQLWGRAVVKSDPLACKVIAVRPSDIMEINRLVDVNELEIVLRGTLGSSDNEKIHSFDPEAARWDWTLREIEEVL